MGDGPQNLATWNSLQDLQARHQVGEYLLQDSQMASDSWNPF